MLQGAKLKPLPQQSHVLVMFWHCTQAPGAFFFSLKQHMTVATEVIFLSWAQVFAFFMCLFWGIWLS